MLRTEWRFVDGEEGRGGVGFVLRGGLVSDGERNKEIKKKKKVWCCILGA